MLERFSDIALQGGLALGWYVAIIVILRIAGKRFAGPVTAYDLVVLITIGVVLQTSLLREGPLNAVVFVVVVFSAHRLTGAACLRSKAFRRLVRGRPRPLVEDGRVMFDALESEGLTYDDLLAGLRKLGHENPAAVHLAILEETGHISAVAR